MSNKAAFIGRADIHSALKQMDDSWDFQTPILTLNDLAKELQKEPPEISSLSPDTSLFVFFSRLYNKTDADKFAKLVAFLMPYSAVCILIPRGDTEEKEKIERSIINAVKSYAAQDPNYNIATPYYFVTYEDAQAQIYDAIYNHINNTHVDPAVVDALKDLLPDSKIPLIAEINDDDDDSDFDEDENIILADKNENSGKIITVTSSKGGCGKSTISLLLASYLAKSTKIAFQNGTITKPFRVCVVDMDTRNGQLGFLNQAVTPNIMTILQKGEPTKQSVVNGIYHNEDSGVDFLLATKRSKNAKQIPESYYAKVIGILRDMYDVVFLDTSVEQFDPLLESVAYPMSDKIVLVSNFVSSSIYGIARWIMEVTTAGGANGGAIDPDKVKIVLNQSLQNIAMDADKIEQAIRKQCEIIGVYPSLAQQVLYAANTGNIHRLLNVKAMNETSKEILEELLPDINLPPVPFSK